jgi:polysaccharide biosynthesis protein PslG
MHRRRGYSALLLPVAVVVLACAIGASWLSHSRSGGDPARKPPARRSAAAAPARAHSIQIGVSDPQLIHESARVQAAQLHKMRSIGLNSVRFDANWSWFEYAGPGIYNWALLDREVHSVIKAGLSVELVIDGCPTWAALPSARHDVNPQPASAAQFAAWAKAVAQRYEPLGVKYLEIWNEPNLAKYWEPKVNPAFYVRMLADSYKAIKSVNPSAVVIAGGLAPLPSTRTSLSMIAFLNAIYKDGAKPYLNAVAVHPYSYPALPSTYESWSAWSQMSQTSPSIRSVMARYKDSGRKVWITEFGAVSNGPGGGGGANGESEELSQAITIARSTPWIGAIYIYTWQDAGADKNNRNDWFGLVTNKGVPKSAYYAVKAAISKKL